jgi:two-component system NtrC family sensor kinase
LETLQRLGNTITSSLDLDSVLTAIVDAAVELTGAEEGSLMLLDDATGELYMRASRNFQEEFVRTFRLPVQDSSIGSVLSSGQPLLIDEQSLQKIKTSYLVHGLVYVPLKLGSAVIGVLGVSNRTERRSFKDHDLTLLSAMGEYAVIAIHNAGLYSATTAERNKLETILTRVEDGVVVLDQESRLVLVNSVARSAFGLDNKDLIGERFEDHFKDEEMTRLVEMAGASLSNRMEVTVADGRVFSGHLTPIPDVGMTITLHDITYLKQLDKIKSDFVGTVSHDLRSPLTAIMGYVELIERAGPVNERQVDFIRRVHQNVQNITRLIDDLLHLGQIESGLDLTKERIPVGQLIKIILDEYQSRLTGKNLTIECSLPDSALYLIGNPVQMRQMFEKLLDNAVKYSMTGGHIDILGAVEQNQVILQVRDSGVGIPSVDMPFIFDKFYRGSNVAGEVQGTGLGLAIVKSIVESHKGRIWVDSTLGEGATFTIVMPVAEG